ncbi:MAG: GNAT family N-acetyltransferase [Planctomycetes bacterium]|nr:GNAT family N-acetyltransferase [Planctomycetota bacterium]
MTEPRPPVAGAPASASELDVRPARLVDDAMVEAFVAAHPRGTTFHRPAWRRAVERSFGHASADLAAWRGEELVGVLPLMRCRGLTGTTHLVSAPYAVYGGPLAHADEVRAALVERALDEARGLGVGRLELRTRERLEHAGLVPSDLYVTFRKPLPASWDEVLKGMKKDERRLVRRAADTHGLELCEGPWFVSDLARLFLESKQRLGSPGLPVEWFEHLLRELGDGAVVHGVRRGSELLAVSLSFVDHGELRMYYIGTTEDANRAYATTSFLIAELQRWGLERGLTGFDLGRSRRDAGAVTFKRNQGFEAEPLHYAYGLVRSKALPSLTPSNPRTRFLREAWSRLPGWMASRLSARLAKHLF